MFAAIITASVRGDATDTASSAGAPPADGGASAQSLDDVDTMIGRLASRLEQNPDDGEGYRMLGWSYVMTDRPELAIAPYKRALALIPDSAAAHSGYGEALVAIAKNTVTDEAKTTFEKALRLDPAEPRARYFLALWDAQHGKEAQALDALVTLANAGPADAPWQADVRREITRLSSVLGTDVSARLAPAASGGAGDDMPVLDSATIQAAQALPQGEQDTMVTGMVDRLAERLAANPKDADGWVRLLRARMVLGQRDQAAADLKSARAGLGKDVAALGRVNAAARELAVPGA
jgi:cytochrome c-type biogenesis protein CcmH